MEDLHTNKREPTLEHCMKMQRKSGDNGCMRAQRKLLNQGGTTDQSVLGVKDQVGGYFFHFVE